MTIPIVKTSFIAGRNRSLTGVFCFGTDSFETLSLISLITFSALSSSSNFFMIFRASSYLPFITSHLGLWGIKSRRKKSIVAGKNSIPSIHLHIYSFNLSGSNQNLVFFFKLKKNKYNKKKKKKKKTTK